MNQFTKQERLTSRKEIKNLFARGNRFTHKMLRVYWHVAEREADTPVKLLITVPAKRIRKATARNLLKRRIREAYRTNKHQLYDFLNEQHHKLSVMFVYTGDKIHPYNEIEETVVQVLTALMSRNEKSH